MTAGILKNFMGFVVNYPAVSTIDTNKGLDALRYKNCFLNWRGMWKGIPTDIGVIPKGEAKEMGYLINSSIILIVLYFWIA